MIAELKLYISVYCIFYVVALQATVGPSVYPHYIDR